MLFLVLAFLTLAGFRTLPGFAAIQTDLGIQHDPTGGSGLVDPDNDGIVEIVNGGTGTNTAFGAITNLKGVYVVDTSGFSPTTLTGTTTITTLWSATIPGGALGANGSLRIYELWSFSNGTTTFRNMYTYFGGAEVAKVGMSSDSDQAMSLLRIVRNRGSETSQVVYNKYSWSSIGNAGSLPTTTAVDTRQDQVLSVAGELGDVSLSLTLEDVMVEIVKP